VKGAQRKPCHNQRPTHHHVDALLDGLLQDLLKGAERVLAPDLVLVVDALRFFWFGLGSGEKRRAMSGRRRRHGGREQRERQSRPVTLLTKWLSVATRMRSMFSLPLWGCV